MVKAAGGKKLVIVESPTKAKTIRKFLGKNYVVESCMGHIRDLPRSSKDIPAKYKKEAWAALGVNVDQDFAPIYLVPKEKTKVVNTLKGLVEGADEVFLATDEDREGESISWHLLEVLKPKVPVKRMVFNEITKEAIDEALTQTRKIDDNLVSAQEARRILDRLVGYTISPLLWKKVAYGLSAGRVQSVAVRLICEKEMDRLKFKKSEYWSITAQLEKANQPFEARLTNYQNKKIAIGKDFDANTGALLGSRKEEVIALNEATSGKVLEAIKAGPWTVTETDERPVFRKPQPPFITSTLQQEASRKLGLTARDAMRVAQQLYEQGFITYMRTDSTFLSNQAISAAREDIQKRYGKEYLPTEPRVYTGKKVKGAQEAHEAIRPAGTHFKHPDETGLNGDQFKMYDLIWKRTMASQMLDAKQKQVSAKIESGEAMFNASGMTIEFPGYLRAYVEGADDPDAALEDREVQLPPLKKGDQLNLKKLDPNKHETKPPARYTEATLIQTMEREGIGRPSTYAPTIGTIIDRGYVQRAHGALAPTFTAMIVNKLLQSYLPQYVDLNFTSQMEKSLDDIAQGDLEMVKYLRDLYLGKDGLKIQVEKQDKKIDTNEARSIEFSDLKGFVIKVGRFGAYVCRVGEKKGEEICASLPDSQVPGDLTAEIANNLIEQKINGADSIGNDPVSGLPVYALNGRYGPYVQLGDVSEEKPKRASVPPPMKLEEVTLEKALMLLSLPKLLGQNPTGGKDIKLGLGRFGPYVVCDGDYRSIPKGEDFLSVTLSRALELFAQPKKGRGRQSALKDLGPHPKDQVVVQLFNGPYGHYVKWGKLNASVPKETTPESVTLAGAIQWLNEKNGNSENANSPIAKKKPVVTKNTKSAAKVATPAESTKTKKSTSNLKIKPIVKAENAKTIKKTNKAAD